MPFPYLAPLSPWIINVMKAREENPLMGSFKSPYAVLTSSALVVKSDPTPSNEKDRKAKIIELIKTPPPGKSYKGCIISNNINNVDLTYTLGESAVGIDFMGNIIKVAEKEKGKKIPTPLIQSIEVDTDGANNTLKTARVSLILFSLKQLEMFELFFMKPGMNCMIEFGDATLLKKNLFTENKEANGSAQQQKRTYAFRDGVEKEFKPKKSPAECLYPKAGDFDAWCKEFSNLYRGDTAAFAKYLIEIEESMGTYDRVAGKVLDYSFEYQEDGTYAVMIEISAGNQVSLAIRNNPKGNNTSQKGSTPQDDKLPEEDQIKAQMVVDLGLNKSNFDDLLKTHPEGKPNWKDDWFNFLKINQEQKDTVASEDAYVSLRFILNILMNYAVKPQNTDVAFFELVLPEYGKDKKKMIPVLSNKFIMSSDKDIIFPTKELPVIEVITKDEPEAGIIEDDKKRKTIDATINGYNFHVDKDVEVIVPEGKNVTLLAKDGDSRVGDACNIFVRYERVVKLWKSTGTRIDFLEKILEVINQNSYGLFLLSYGLQVPGGKPTVIDIKAGNQRKLLSDDEIYRFKAGTINSNVKQFSFNLEMSTLVAGRQVFNSGKLVAEAKKEQAGQPKDDYDYDMIPAKVFKQFDNSAMGNADGWWSINGVELNRVSATIKQGYDNSSVTTQQDKEEDKSVTKTEDITNLIDSKSIKFLMGKETKKLIYTDTVLIMNRINNTDKDENKSKPAKSVLSPIDISLTVDGFSGFNCGQYFEVDGIPEIYNRTGVFQITNIKHSISENEWITVIEASHRTMDKKK